MTEPIHECRSLTPAPFNIKPQQSSSVAISHMAQRLLDVARHYEPGIIADSDTECVHQYRVNLRKLRSLLKLSKKALAPDLIKPLRQQLKEIAGQTGELRDLDVFILDCTVFAEQLPPELRPGLKQLRARLQGERAGVITSVQDILQSFPYEEQIRCCEEAINSLKMQSDSMPLQADVSVGVFARKRVLRQYRKLCILVENISHESTDAELHKVRIQIKQLRYLLDLFGEILPSKKTGTIIHKLKKVQDSLGRFNDFSVQRRFVNNLLQQEELNVAQRDSLIGLSAILFQYHLRESAEAQKKLTRFCSPKTSKRIKKISGHK